MSYIQNTITRDVVVRLQCDLCGQKSEDDQNWARKHKEQKVINISFIETEIGAGMKESFHICPDCWHTKLAVWFLQQGISPTIEEYIGKL